MRRRRIRGVALVGLITSLIAAMILGAVLISVGISNWTWWSVVAGTNTAGLNVRQTLDTISDKMRYAAQNPNDQFSVLTAASGDSVTFYSKSTGDTIRYWRDSSTDPPTLKSTATVGGTATTTTILTGLTSLQFTYYVSGNVYNAPAGSWVTTASPHAATTDELRYVGAIFVEVTYAIDTRSRYMSTLIRLRNSPHKTTT